MTLIGAFVVACAFILGVLSCRGTVVQRGQFCKCCRFDLSGLSTNEDDCCPECGSTIHLESSRRTTRRSAHRLGLIAAGIMMCIGVGAISFSVWGNPAAVYAQLPNSLLMQGVYLGSNEALDEASARYSTSPEFSKVYGDRLIKHALSKQADVTQPWDPRIGELLAYAWASDQFSDEQLVSYLNHAIQINVLIRDRVQQGSKGIRCTVDVYSNRIHSINPITSGTSLEIGLLSTHIEGDRTRYSSDHEIQSSLGSFGLNVPAQSSSWELGGHLRIESSEGEIEYEVGEKVQVTVEFELRLVDTQTREETLYKTMTVRELVEVISKDEPIVGTVVDESLVQQMCKTFQISNIHAVNALSNDHQSWNPIFGFSSFTKQGFPVAIALRAYLAIDGQELEIGRFVQKQSGEGAVGSSFTWNADPENPDEFENAQQVLRRIHEIGKADIVYRTDPIIAEGSPAINEVLDLELIFRDVPVVGVESHGMIWQSLSNPEWQEAECDD
jgi:hypothetical protein